MAPARVTMPKVDDTREVLDIACRDLEDVSKRTLELKRKASSAHDWTTWDLGVVS